MGGKSVPFHEHDEDLELEEAVLPDPQGVQEQQHIQEQQETVPDPSLKHSLTSRKRVCRKHLRIQITASFFLLVT